MANGVVRVIGNDLAPGPSAPWNAIKGLLPRGAMRRIGRRCLWRFSVGARAVPHKPLEEAPRSVFLP
jgi:hypothetical protein